MTLKLAIVVSRFNQEVTQKLLDGALNRLNELNISIENVQQIWVPGALEIPLMAQHFARRGMHAVICLGAVIKGETDHYEYVCQQVSYGCQRVALDHNIPVIFGVLTTQTTELAMARVDGTHSDKGREAVDSALEMIKLLKPNCSYLQSKECN